jgi:gliding motility-associated-like protein
MAYHKNNIVNCDYNYLILTGNNVLQTIIIMKRVIILFLLSILSSLLHAQKEGNVWVYGENTGLNFNTNPPSVYNSSTYSNEACSSVCDKNGNLILYSSPKINALNNTISVWNKNNNIIHNGDTLNGWFSITQGILLLPNPKYENKYWLLHLTEDLACHLYYSTIDMNCNGNNGCVLKKNQQVLPIFDVSEKMNAVRHANGRDWWVMLHGSADDAFYKFLVTADTVLFHDVQHIGSTFVNDTINPDGIGQLMFSRDGSKLATVFRKADVFDFDRCTGELSNWFYIGNLPLQNYGVSFSNNNRFIYISNWDYYANPGSSLFQYDLNAPNVLNSKNVIYSENISDASFWSHGYGPDGKIYILLSNAGYPYYAPLNWSDSYYTSFIENPDSLGASCNFIRNGIYMGGHKIGIGLPNIPNYALGKIEGSACDTIKEPLPPIEKHPVIYIPNIFSPNNDNQNDVFYVRGEGIASLHLLIYNRWGNKVFESNDITQGWDGTQHGQKCESGVYIYRAEITFTNGETITKRGDITLVR